MALPQNILQLLQRSAEILNSELNIARCDPREEVIVRYTSGTGKFSPDKRFISLKMYMTKVNGEVDGWHEGVWEAAFSDPKELLKRPDPPVGPLNEPVGPVPDVSPRAHTKAVWTFSDDSAIYAVGPALSHLMPLDDKSSLFVVTCAQVITGGEGKYKDCRGLKTSLGSTWNDKDLFAATGEVTFHALTLDTFRIIRGDNVA